MNKESVTLMSLALNGKLCDFGTDTVQCSITLLVLE